MSVEHPFNAMLAVVEEARQKLDRLDLFLKHVCEPRRFRPCEKSRDDRASAERLARNGM